jgi:hypothetical protein
MTDYDGGESQIDSDIMSYRISHSMQCQKDRTSLLSHMESDRTVDEGTSIGPSYDGQ